MRTPGTLFGLHGKTALVTGASYGLGVSLAEALAGAGATVVLTARSKDKLADAVEAINQAGGKALSFPCDVTDPAQVEQLVDRVWNQCGRIDILVNNAGIAEGGVPEQVEHDSFERTISVNLLGLWYATRAVARRQLADGRGGSIINIASICGLIGLDNHPPAYQATKFAVVGLTRNLAVTWGGRGIRVNAIAPGYFPSELTGPILASEHFHNWAKSSAALRRIGRTGELDGAVVFLASDASSFVTGQTLAVDGGWTAGGGANPLPEEFLTSWGDALPGDLGKRISADV
jgi:NAD(P)-dependent dehydrogenase (short-subunit alcohol dehydrogenase family)